MKKDSRPSKCVLQRQVANKLAEELLSGWIEDGETVRIGLAEDESGLTFETVKASATPPETAAAGEPVEA